MSETLTHFQVANHDIVNLAAMSLSAGSHLSEAERTTRCRTVIRGTKAFQPTDAAQTMLGTLVLGHHLTIMDGFRDLACLTLTPAEAARARMVTVAQTKLVLLLLREIRVARAEALPWAANEEPAPESAPESAQESAQESAGESAGDAGYEATLANFRTGYAEALATLQNTAQLTPAAAAMAGDALSQAVSPALFTAREEATVAAPVTGNRAQRRAMMKRNGGFRHHA